MKFLNILWSIVVWSTIVSLVLYVVGFILLAIYTVSVAVASLLLFAIIAVFKVAHKNGG